MTTKEKIADYPFNSDYEEKLLLDELISNSYSGERLYISYNCNFTCVHEKTLNANMCKTVSCASCENDEQSFSQKLTWLKTAGGQTIVC